jgi:hypothetical protein
MAKKKVDDNLMVVYSLRLTKAQRIKLLQLGGPEWIRTQIERSTELCSLGTSDTGQVRPGRLPKTSGTAGGA